MKSIKEDNKTLIDLILTAKGNRSYRQYAQDAGISNASIVRIIKGDYTPSAKTLMRLTSEEAKPQGGVTYEDMMIAAGLQPDQGYYIDNIIESYAAEEHIDYKVDEDAINDKKSPLSSEDNILMDMKGIDGSAAQAAAKRLYMYYRLINQKFEARGKGIIYKAALENDIEIQKGNDYSDSFSGKTFDLHILVKNQKIKSWGFDFVVFREDLMRLAKQQILEKHLAKLVMIAPDCNRKLSLVIKDPNIYDTIKGYSGSISYRGELSVVLINEENTEVVDEVYLSHYDEEDTSREIYLTPIQKVKGK